MSSSVSRELWQAAGRTAVVHVERDCEALERAEAAVRKVSPDRARWAESRLCRICGDGQPVGALENLAEAVGVIREEQAEEIGRGIQR